jgi:hypothetical protein
MSNDKPSLYFVTCDHPSNVCLYFDAKLTGVPEIFSEHSPVRRIVLQVAKNGEKPQFQTIEDICVNTEVIHSPEFPFHLKYYWKADNQDKIMLQVIHPMMSFMAPGWNYRLLVEYDGNNMTHTTSPVNFGSEELRQEITDLITVKDLEIEKNIEELKA